MADLKPDSVRKIISDPETFAIIGNENFNGANQLLGNDPNLIGRRFSDVSWPGSISACRSAAEKKRGVLDGGNVA
jgi:hypothetical protein